MSQKTITFDDLNEVNRILQDQTDESFVNGANYLLEQSKTKAKITKATDAQAIIQNFLDGQLKEKNFLAAATLLFGYNLFDPRPVHMGELFTECNKSARLSIVGAASSSKSFGVGVWILMDYLLDPSNTKVLVTSMQEKHLKQELFSDLIRAVQNSVMPLGLETSLSSMRIIPEGQKSDASGIFGKAFPQDDNTSTGRFRGIKPKRRSKPHPEFGLQTRVRVFIDEASSVSGGVFLDIGSIEASIDGNEIVKIFMAFNPTSTNHPTCQLSEPDGGIYCLNPDEDYRWESKAGWNVYRLDGARSPNVIARENICAGVMSYEAFLGYLKAGDNSHKYWVYGRGIWAMKGAINNVLPMDIITRNVGDFVFPRGSTNVASADLAFGNDKVVFTLGRWGKASAWVDQGGKREMFTHNGEYISKWSLQVDQQFEIGAAHDSITLSQELVKLCKQFKVSPNWFALDRTAIGKGVYDYMRTNFGDVYGINWQEKASSIKITSEDAETPELRYANISSEMWFGLASWLEHGIMKISNYVPATPLFHQLSSRRYKSGRGGRAQVESKPEYKSRGHSNSPDHADSLVQLPMLCRMRGQSTPSIKGIDEDKEEEEGDWDDDDIYKENPNLKCSDQVDNLSYDGNEETGRSKESRYNVAAFN